MGGERRVVGGEERGMVERKEERGREKRKGGEKRGRGKGREEGVNS